MENVVTFPFRWVEKLIKAGVLRAADRHDARAVQRAVNLLRERSKTILGHSEDDGSPNSPSGA